MELEQEADGTLALVMKEFNGENVCVTFDRAQRTNKGEVPYR